MRAPTRTLASLLIITLLFSSPIVAFLPTASADETVPPSSPILSRLEAQDAVLKGLDWFASKQTLDGGWGGDLGVTAFIALCFATAGFDHTNRTAQNALEYIRRFYNPDDGTNAVDFLNYDSSLALMAMSGLGDPEDAQRIEGISGFLDNLQFPSEGWYNLTDDWYVGGWPNHAGIPDISNSQFALLAQQCAELYAGDELVDDQVWAMASDFVTECQNWPDVNDLPWAHNQSLPSHGDGGFVYNGYRSRTPLGEQMFESYGSITAGGLYSYLVSRNDPRQPEVQAARRWLEREYNYVVNPRMIGKGLYYYLWSQARAFAMSSQDWVVDGSGKLHDWRPETARHFMDLQRPNGGWPGNPEIGWREEEPELASVYALLSIMAGYMVIPNPELTLSVSGASKVRFIDSQGRAMRTDGDLGLEVTDSTLKCTDPEVFRKVWVIAEGGTEATLTATGTWGEGRTSQLTRTASMASGRATFHVASGSFAGPFGIHVMAFGDAPQLTVSKNRLELKRGETEVLEFDLKETSGKGPVVDAKLITLVGAGVVADVDKQGVDVAAGGQASLGLTISVDEDPGGTSSWAMVITSATAPPQRIDVELASEDEGGLTYAYLYTVIIVILVLLALLFFLLPGMGRGTGEVPEEETEGKHGEGQ